jgi:hypothetical protein
MKSKWIKNKDFNFGKHYHFECYILMEGEVRKATFMNGTFSFQLGFCGKGVPTHIMMIKKPKSPILIEKENNASKMMDDAELKRLIWEDWESEIKENDPRESVFKFMKLMRETLINKK